MNIIACMGQKRLVYDPTYPAIDHSIFKMYAWTEFHWDDKEAICMKAPEPTGQEVVIHKFVNNDHREGKKS